MSAGRDKKSRTRERKKQKQRATIRANQKVRRVAKRAYRRKLKLRNS